MTVAYTDKDQVKKALAGDTPNFSIEWDATLEGLSVSVSAELDREVARARGITAPWSFVADDMASERRFTGQPGGTRYLPIDDCVEIASVTTGGRTLVPDVDYVPSPLNGMPITGLILLAGVWDDTPGANLVSARWGYADEDPPADAVATSTREVIRAYLAARAGNDDRLGMTPFGAVITSKAFTSQTWALIHSYGRKTGGGRA